MQDGRYRFLNIDVQDGCIRLGFPHFENAIYCQLLASNC
jgi:hypothetical protein